MGIFSFFKKKEKKEIEEEIKISEEEKLLSDLQKAITLLKQIIKPNICKSKELLNSYFLDIQKLLVSMKDRIYLIENIAKNRIDESLKTGNYRKASLEYDLKKAHETLGEAKAELTDIGGNLLSMIAWYAHEERWNDDEHEGWLKKNEWRVNRYWLSKRKERIAKYNQKLSYLETLEKSIIYLIGLEKKAKEQS